MFNKKSVIGGLLLSASTLGVVGGAVATQNAMEAPVQKHAESQNERATASSKSSVSSNEKKAVDNKPSIQTASSASDTTVDATPVESAEPEVEQNYVSAPKVTLAKDFTYDVMNITPSNSNDKPVTEATTLTYQAKPALVGVKAPVANTVPELNSAVVNRAEVSVSENKATSETVAQPEDAVKTTDVVADAKPVEENATTDTNVAKVESIESKPVENQVSEHNTASEPVATEDKAPAIPENEVVHAEPASVANPEPVTGNVAQPVEQPAPAQPVREHPQYSSTADSYPVGECTWGVKTVAPWVGDYWGNGGQWADSAARDGFRTGKTAEVGSVVSWDDGGYGHVAYVTDVDQTTGYVKVLESNYNGNRTIQDYRGWFDASNPMWGNATYIYQN